MPASFSNGFGSVTFSRAPLYPEGSNDLLQASAESTGGEPVSRDPLGQVQPLTLQWRGMSKTDRIALEVFFITAARGIARTFIYTDIAGTALIVRFAVPELKFSETAYERYTVTVPLLREP